MKNFRILDANNFDRLTKVTTTLNIKRLALVVCAVYFLIWMALPLGLLNLISSVYTVGLVAYILDSTLRRACEQAIELKHYNLNSQNLIHSLPCPVVYVNTEFRVLYWNQKAEELLSAEKLRKEALCDLVEERSQGRVKKLVERAFSGQVPQEEVSIFKGPNLLGTLFNASVGKWKESSVVMITINPISQYLGQRELVYQVYSDLLKEVVELNKVVESYHNKPIDRNLICKLRELLLFARGSVLLQSHFRGQIEVVLEHFNLDKSVQSVVETQFIKALDKGIELCYSKSQKMPTSLQGDYILNELLVATLLDYCISKSISGGKVSLDLKSYTSAKYLFVQYKFTFSAENLSTPELISTFTVRGNNIQRKSFLQITKEYNMNGVCLTMFDSMLLIMRGAIIESNVRPEIGNMVTIVMEIPFKPSSHKVKHPVLRLSPFALEKSEDCVVWNPNKDAFQRFYQILPRAKNDFQESKTPMGVSKQESVCVEPSAEQEDTKEVWRIMQKYSR